MSLEYFQIALLMFIPVTMAMLETEADDAFEAIETTKAAKNPNVSETATSLRKRSARSSMTYATSVASQESKARPDSGYGSEHGRDGKHARICTYAPQH